MLSENLSRALFFDSLKMSQVIKYHQQHQERAKIIQCSQQDIGNRYALNNKVSLSHIWLDIFVSSLDSGLFPILMKKSTEGMFHLYCLLLTMALS